MDHQRQYFHLKILLDKIKKQKNTQKLPNLAPHTNHTHQARQALRAHQTHSPTDQFLDHLTVKTTQAKHFQDKTKSAFQLSQCWTTKKNPTSSEELTESWKSQIVGRNLRIIAHWWTSIISNFSTNFIIYLGHFL